MHAPEHGSKKTEGKLACNLKKQKQKLEVSQCLMEQWISNCDTQWDGISSANVLFTAIWMNPANIRLSEKGKSEKYKK